MNYYLTNINFDHSNELIKFIFILMTVMGNLKVLEVENK